MPEQNELLYPRPPDLYEQLKELERELEVRKHVYPGWIERGKIKLQTANYRIACLKATIAFLKGQVEEGQ